VSPNRTLSKASHPLGEIWTAGTDLTFVEELYRWLGGPLHGCTAGAVREARIVAGELVANAFGHGAPPFAVRVSLVGGARMVRLEVDDGGSLDAMRWQPRRGLRLVRRLCETWGVANRQSGKTVWAELPVLVSPSPLPTGVEPRQSEWLPC